MKAANASCLKSSNLLSITLYEMIPCLLFCHFRILNTTYKMLQGDKTNKQTALRLPCLFCVHVRMLFLPLPLDKILLFLHHQLKSISTLMLFADQRISYSLKTASTSPLWLFISCPLYYEFSKAEAVLLTSEILAPDIQWQINKCLEKWSAKWRVLK